ncbi:Protein-export membrane protein SecG [BD1-7 clade bacterium]|uniref:Protein-export membrane protein SecG n=1 Tax=BD1-7 clade bacterium TaxID=2029982 RepID=A0A5S9MW84_9GAMM|nr:Protein-export membrane protein SecG [BD1-7 clade bacterium]
MLEQLILVVHAIVAIAILALIMLQQGKGAEMGASFGGGSSQTVFGVQGGGNLLTRWTAVLAAVFFATSLTLAYFAREKSGVAYEVDVPAIPAAIEVMQPQQEINEEIPALPVNQAVPAESEVPVVPADEAPSNTATDMPSAKDAGQ